MLSYFISGFKCYVFTFFLIVHLVKFKPLSVCYFK